MSDSLRRVRNWTSGIGVLVGLALGTAACIPLDPDILIDSSPSDDDSNPPSATPLSSTPVSTDEPSSPSPGITVTPQLETPSPVALTPGTPAITPAVTATPSQTPTPALETPTPALEAPTAGLDTPTPGSGTPTPWQETPTPWIDPPTPWIETPTPGVGTPTPPGLTPLPVTPTPALPTPALPTPALPTPALPTPTVTPEPTQETTDADGDGYPSSVDCDDGNEYTYPGQDYDWVGDGADNDCDTLEAEATTPSAPWLIGSAGDDQLGYRIVVVDQDRDGIQDVLISAPGVDVDSNARDAGAVYLFYGGSDLRSRLSSLSNANATFRGKARNDRLGSEVVGGRDLDGDKRNDLVITAPSAGSGRGAIYVFYGGTSRFSGVISVASANAYMEGEGNSDKFGTSVCLSPSTSILGAYDIAVGAPSYAAGGGPSEADRGKVYRISGGSKRLGVISVEAENTLQGGQPGDFFGATLGCPGDFTGDSTYDLMIGAPGSGTPESGETDESGSVLLASITSSGVVSMASYYGDAGSAAGTALLSTGDVIGDTKPDLLIGASEFDGGVGRLYLLPGGPADGTYRDLSHVPLIVSGAGSPEGLGLAGTLSVIGDLEGDGQTDIAVGLPGSGITAFDGIVFVFRLEALASAGVPLEIDVSSASIMVNGSSSEQLGWCTAGYSQAGAPTFLLMAANYYDAPSAMHVGAVYGLQGYPAETLP